MYCDYKFENLTELLSDNIITGKDDPFEASIVVCSSKTMEQYLNKTIADTKTIAANISYRFPRNSINDILAKCAETESVTRLDKDIMLWEIYRLLPELENEAIYQPIKEYLNTEPSLKPFRRYQLSRKIAEIFDSYIGYRGEWLEAWQEGQIVSSKKHPKGLGAHEHWQADLWRKLTVEKTKCVRFMRTSELLSRYINKIKPLLPEKMSIFGISNLSPDYISFFAVLSHAINLEFYYLTPCVQYWGDASRKDADRNFLLASWGIIGRDFQDLLLNSGFPVGDIVTELKIEDCQGSLLTALQYDILNDISSNPEESCIAQISTANFAKDRSIIVNNCYTRMREVEILHDYILDLLCNNDLDPSDIVVMAPDIEKYAPYIQAVFPNAESAKFAGITETVPYTLADCSTIYTLPEAETFMKVLSLADGKMTSEDIFEIISSEPVMKKFGISNEESEEIYDLISSANIAWGKDSKHREQILGQKYPDINTWEFGFERILAGYAFDTDEPLPDGTLPLSLDGGSGIIAGKFISMTKDLFSYAKIISKPHTPEKWAELLKDIITKLFELPNSKNEDTTILHQTVTELYDLCNEAKVTEKLPIDVIKTAISASLQGSDSARRSFFRGGVTFCQLLPMRNIPFKSICLLGMNDTEFPRIATKSGFDLTQCEPQRGDRSLRNEDSFIFLELILACRKNLYLSYIGQRSSKNEEISPSILVDEMLDHITTARNIKKESLITNHPLHPFDEKYFIKSAKNNSEELFTYSDIYRKAGEAFANFANSKKTEEGQYKELPPSQDASLYEFTFDEFVSFFTLPSKFFLRYRLNINLYDDTIEPLKTSEPMSIGPLEAYKMKSDIMRHKTTNLGYDLKAKLLASGELPPKIWGKSIIDKNEEIVDNMLLAINQYGKKLPQTEEKILKYTIDGQEITFRGSFKDLYNNAMVFFRPSSIKNKDRIQAYFWHRLAIEAGVKFQETAVLGYNRGKVEIANFINPNLTPAEESENIEETLFEELVKIFICGLRKPLPLFQESSMKYIKQKNNEMLKINKRIENIKANLKIKKETEELDTIAEDQAKEEIEKQALQEAAGQWSLDDHNYSTDLKEKANLICFGETPPPENDKLKDEFARLAEKAYKTINP